MNYKTILFLNRDGNGLDHHHHHHHHHMDGSAVTPEQASSSSSSNNVCITPNCSCLMHHSNQYGGGVINSDGTIYISEIKYVQNYLQSFLYIEELQKFKEEEYYRESLELEPDPPGSAGSGGMFHSPVNHSPGKFSQTVTSLGFATAAQQQQSQQQCHRKTHSLFNGAHSHHSPSSSSALVAETKDAINDYKLRHHPLDDSLVEASLPSNGVSSYFIAFFIVIKIIIV